MQITVDDIIIKANELRCSDVHIIKGIPIRGRVDGELQNIYEDIVTEEESENFAKWILNEEYKEIIEIGEIDLAKTFSNGTRCRINVFRQQNAVSMAIRLLSDKIPVLTELGLPPAVLEFPEFNRGIVLVTGETGSGKSTTLASILDSINHSRNAHIVTLEDPIEYIYTPDKCAINQREIGQDTRSYEDGLRAILREDPDVILVGEMRDLSTIEIALTAAETGHLVFATLHTNSAAEAIDRMVDVFPEGQQRQIRLQLSNTLMAVLSQQLLPRKEGKGRIVACEVMMVNHAIRNLIREAKTSQIMNAIATSAKEGSITMDNAIVSLYKEKKISAEIAQKAARDEEYVKKLTLF